MEINRDEIYWSVYDIKAVIFFTIATCIGLVIAFRYLFFLGLLIAVICFKILDTHLSLARCVDNGNFFVIRDTIQTIEPSRSIICTTGEILLGAASDEFKVGEDVFLVIIKGATVLAYACADYKLNDDVKQFLKND